MNSYNKETESETEYLLIPSTGHQRENAVPAGISKNKNWKMQQGVLYSCTNI